MSRDFVNEILLAAIPRGGNDHEDENPRTRVASVLAEVRSEREDDLHEAIRIMGSEVRNANNQVKYSYDREKVYKDTYNKVEKRLERVKTIARNLVSTDDPKQMKAIARRISDIINGVDND